MTVKKMINYRQVWMGFAMLWIMLYHADFSFGRFSFIQTYGYSGVDIFLFASGIGYFYSYTKDEAPLAFIKRRILRLAPAYLPFIIIWCAYKYLFDNMAPINIIGNIIPVQGFASEGLIFNWYLTALVLCYILTPYLAAFVKKNSGIKNALLVAVFVIISIAFRNDDRLIVSVARVPVYIVGMILAKYSKTKIEKSTSPSA